MKVLLDVDSVVRDLMTGLETSVRENFPDETFRKSNTFDIARWTSLGDYIYSYLLDNNGVTKEIYENSPPIDGAIEGCREIVERGHELVFVTSQPNKLCKHHTLNWLMKHDIDFDAIIFTKEKWRVEGDIFVDDCEDNLIKYHYYHLDSTRNTKVIAFNQLWNQLWAGLRVKSWKQLMEVIKHEESYNNK